MGVRGLSPFSSALERGASGQLPAPHALIAHPGLNSRMISQTVEAASPQFPVVKPLTRAPTGVPRDEVHAFALPSAPAICPYTAWTAGWARGRRGNAICPPSGQTTSPYPASASPNIDPRWPLPATPLSFRASVDLSAARDLASPKLEAKQYAYKHLGSWV